MHDVLGSVWPKRRWAGREVDRPLLSMRADDELPTSAQR